MYDRRPASTAWSIAFAPAPKPEAAILGSFQFAISHLHNQPVHTGRSDNIGGFPARFKRNRTSAIFEQQLSRARFGVAVRNIAAYAVRHVHADRKSVVEGKSVSVRVDLGGRRILQKKQKKSTTISDK